MGKVIEKTGSVRVDLVGGTLDLDPICSILGNTVTINLATSLEAKVILTSKVQDGISIYSHDYKKNYFFSYTELSPVFFYKQGKLNSDHFQEMLFIALICDHFNVRRDCHLELISGAPAGSGLGGSSAMGITLAKVLLQYHQIEKSPYEIVGIVRKIEEMILCRGVAGYQDYFPALYGGILALKPNPAQIKVEQCYEPTLVKYLEENLVLVYSGQSRISGINNWEVYKAFFDQDPKVVQGLIKIAQYSHQAYEAMKVGDGRRLLELVAIEGAERKKLFSNIATAAMNNLTEEIEKKFPGFLGMKVCGAGGGGCFLLVGVSAGAVESIVKKFEMQVLPLNIAPPIEQLS